MRLRLCLTLVVCSILCACGDWANEPVEKLAEWPMRVTVCQLLQDPARYNNQQIEITGTVSRGFEDFTLSESTCKNDNLIWLEFGGMKGSEVMYCCGITATPKRPETLIVEGVKTSIVEDAALERFEELTKVQEGYGRARATLVGRYFSGKKTKLPGGTFWMGYGHMGIASLLVIEQVKDVQPL